MKRAEVGMWVWETLTVALAFACIVVVFWSGFYLMHDGAADKYHFVDAPDWLAGLFVSLKEHGTLVGGILGFSGLAWSHFYSASDRPTRAEAQPPAA